MGTVNDGLLLLVIKFDIEFLVLNQVLTLSSLMTTVQFDTLAWLAKLSFKSLSCMSNEKGFFVILIWIMKRLSLLWIFLAWAWSWQLELRFPSFLRTLESTWRSICQDQLCFLNHLRRLLCLQARNKYRYRFPFLIFINNHWLKWT